MIIKEFVTFKHNLLLEFAQMTNKKDFFYQNYGKIKVYGGGEDGNTKEHNPPHFHIEMNNGSEIRIIIPKNINDKLISLDDEINSKLIKNLIKWFNEPFKTDNKKNNLEALQEYWNTLNDGDENIDKI